EFGWLDPIPVLVAPGNHDYFTPGCLYDRVAWSPNVRIFREPSLQPFALPGLTIWGAAFTGPERHDSPLENFAAPPDGRHVGLFHADVVSPGETSVYGPLDPADLPRAGLRFAMLGHIHAGRCDEANRFAYPGSLEPLDVSEVGPRWALLIEIERDSCQVETIPVARRQVIAEAIDVSALTTRQQWTDLIEGRRAAWRDRDVALQIRGVLQGELAANPSLLREALAEFDVAPRVQAEPFPDLGSLARQATTLGLFVRTVQATIDEAVGEAEKARWRDILRAGVAAFRGQEEFLP
ncbi:MAG TPA: hypothetical protein VFZ25_06325, partial [Chloroflexota bacterium]|nr:hypothetical protein [Chloroflexota bacterium]